MFSFDATNPLLKLLVFNNVFYKVYLKFNQDFFRSLNDAWDLEMFFFNLIFIKLFICISKRTRSHWAYSSCLHTAKIHFIDISCPQIWQVVWSGFVHAWIKHLELSSPPHRVHCTGWIGSLGMAGSWLANRLSPDPWEWFMVAAVVRASRNLEKCPEVFCPVNALSSSEATLVTGIGLGGRIGGCDPTCGG